MKKTIIKLFDKVILLLLGFSGIFYSCYKYGMIESEYEINGTVTDKTGKEIQDIHVINKHESDTLHTNSEGKFYVKGWGYPVLKVEDIDGDANGGHFKTRDVYVEFTDADLVKRGRGNKTPDKYAKTINVTLEQEEIIAPEYGVIPAPFKP